MMPVTLLSRQLWLIGRDSMVACVSIHLFVIAARDFHRTPDINVSARMIFIDCLENIAGPIIKTPNETKCSSKLLKGPVLVEFQGIVAMTIRQTNDLTLIKIFSPTCAL